LFLTLVSAWVDVAVALPVLSSPACCVAGFVSFVLKISRKLSTPLCLSRLLRLSLLVKREDARVHSRGLCNLACMVALFIHEGARTVALLLWWCVSGVFTVHTQGGSSSGGDKHIQVHLD